MLSHTPVRCTWGFEMRPLMRSLLAKFRFPRSTPSAPPALMMDFARRQKRGQGSGLALLAAGAAALSLSLLMSDLAREDLDRLEHEMAGLDGERKSSRPAVSPRASLKAAEIDDQVRKANQVIRQLALPWGTLLQALERAGNKDVALLSIEPDVSRNVIKAGAEARNPSAMLSYLERIAEGGVFDAPVLLSHQVVAEDPQKPIRFIFTASWQATKQADK